MGRGKHGILAALLLSALTAGPALAACPQELAVYEGADGTGGLEFRGAGDGMLSEMRLLYEGTEPVTAYLSHDDALDRTVTLIPLNCPEGDVTGEELAACLVYQGAVYALANEDADALPAPAEDAAEKLFLPNLASALWNNPQFGEAGPKDRPAEIFQLSGCQE